MVKAAATLLIIAGVLGLMYGHFNMARETHGAKVGSIEVSVTENQKVNIPTWASIGAIIIGTSVLLLGYKSGNEGD